MGIYSDGKIYGITWDIYDKDAKFIKRWEFISDVEMTTEEIATVQTKYNLLTPEELEYCTIYVRTSCSDTYGEDFSTYYSWFSIKEYQLLDLFEGKVTDIVF